jgi:hypothetical protein
VSLGGKFLKALTIFADFSLPVFLLLAPAASESDARKQLKEHVLAQLARLSGFARDLRRVEEKTL